MTDGKTLHQDRRLVAHDRRPHPQRHQGQHDVLADGHGAEQRAALEGHAELFAEVEHLHGGQFLDILAEDLHGPGIGFQRSRWRLGHR